MNKYLKIPVIILTVLSTLSIILVILYAKHKFDWEFKDVSNESQYSQFIGQEFLTKKELYIVKIVQNKGAFNGKENIYSVMDVDSKNPAFLSKDVLPVNTKLRLEKVVRCTGCRTKEEDAIVVVLSTEKYSDASVYFDLMELLVRNNLTTMVKR